MALSARQQAFVDEYCVDRNAKQAYIRAGYSAKTAETAGPRLFGNVEVRAAIDAKLAKLAEKVEVDAQWVLERLKREADGKGQDTTSAARTKATELLGKHLGLFEERIHVTGAPLVWDTEADG